MLHRTEVIQRIVNRLHARSYLEIGVEYGTVLYSVKVAKRIGVDPHFKISWRRKLRYLFPALTTKLFEIPSDEFFAQNPDALPQEGIDVVFIDGLHTYDQSLRDVLNCVKRLRPGGVILMHDCNPPTKSASLLTQEEAGSTWCGDVWKTIVCLRSLHPELTARVLDTDYGIGMVAVGKAQTELLPYTKEAIDALTYEDLDRDREKHLGLTPVSEFDRIVSELHPFD